MRVGPVGASGGRASLKISGEFEDFGFKFEAGEGPPPHVGGYNTHDVRKLGTGISELCGVLPPDVGSYGVAGLKLVSRE